MQDLKGKVAFVTGGSSGIGQGIVKVLAGEGMKVAFSYRRQDHLQQTRAYFRDRPGESVHPISSTSRIARRWPTPSGRSSAPTARCGC